MRTQMRGRLVIAGVAAALGCGVLPATAAAAATAAPADVPASYQMSIDMQAQQYDQWCWAASGTTIADFDGHSTDQNSFCKLAHHESGETCGNNPGYLSEVSDAFDQLGFSDPGTAVAQEISFDEIQQEIANDQPIETRIGWTSGGGHMHVLYGYDADAGTVEYGDPWGDNQRYNSMNFTDYQSNSEFAWTDTLSGIVG